MKKLVIIVLLFLSISQVEASSSLIVEDLNTPEEHIQFLKNSLKQAQSEIIIVSPQISIYRLSEGSNDSIASYIQQARQRDVNVTVLTDNALDWDRDKQQVRDNAQNGRDLLTKLNVKLKIAKRIHTKNVIVDNNCFATGSFNWLGAVTNVNSDYCRLETSCVRRGEDLSQAIDEFKLALFYIPILRSDLKDSEELKLIAEYDIENAIALFKKYYSNNIYRSLVSSILYNHVGYANSIRLNLKILSLLETSIEPQMLVSSALDLIRYVSNRKEHLYIVEYVNKHNPVEAKRIARDLLTYNREPEEYDEFDMMYQTLKTLDMSDIGNQLEEIIIFGASPKNSKNN